ncbi:glycosyltransferase family 2 protein [Candidatus Oscillochloris fontis]|uniref:glycosyltransferase family 2 protein n=1 Tax=Candidatus Oscillochloris fontis TaxID=2496868 RepID=UPI001EE7E31F|nr:glycosyltransferase family 2 protein [Candidatus Oscillochloris fontis]
MHQQVAVVIVSYNTINLLRRCLATLADCHLPLRVLVVDNCSPDGSAAMVRAEFPQVELIALDQNVGFARGTNVGLAALDLHGPDAPAVLLLNPDTEVRPGAIEALVAFLDAHPRVGLVGPRLLNPDGSLQAAAFRFPTLLMTALDLFPPGEVLPGRLYNSWWHGRYPQEGGSTPFPIDHPLGACMLVRPAVLKQVGGLDDSYFMYSEEIDWCWRIRAAGWAIWQVPHAEVVHVGGASTRQFRWKMLVALYRSRAQFVDRHAPPWMRVAHRLVVRTGMLRAVLRSWHAFARGQISHAELRSHLLAYGRISRL